MEHQNKGTFKGKSEVKNLKSFAHNITLTSTNSFDILSQEGKEHIKPVRAIEESSSEEEMGDEEDKEFQEEEPTKENPMKAMFKQRFNIVSRLLQLLQGATKALKVHP